MTRSLRTDRAGIVYVEFLLCFLPVFLLFLGTVQLSLLHAARLTVKFAAARGVRSAVVVLADDPQFYEGEEIGLLEPPDDEEGEGGQGERRSFVDGLGQLLGIDTSAVLALWSARESSQRLEAVRKAVYMPLTALAPNVSDILGLMKLEDGARSLSESYDDEHATRLLAGLLYYNDLVTSVRFPQVRRGDTFHEGAIQGEPDELTLRVTYLYRCSVPLVSALMCRSAHDIALSYLEQTAVKKGSGEPTPEEEEARLLDDLDHIPSRAGLSALLASRAHFYVLREEATAGAEWAPYTFRSEKNDD